MSSHNQMKPPPSRVPKLVSIQTPSRDSAQWSERSRASSASSTSYARSTAASLARQNGHQPHHVLHRHDRTIEPKPTSKPKQVRNLLVPTTAQVMSSTRHTFEDLETVLAEIRTALKEKLKPHDNIPQCIVRYLQLKHNLSHMVNIERFLDGDSAEEAKTTSILAVATQRATALFGLEQQLLSATAGELSHHIAAARKYGEQENLPADYLQKEFVGPLEAQARELQIKAEASGRRQTETQHRFEHYRQQATRPLMEQLQLCIRLYDREFAMLAPADLQQLSDTIKTVRVSGSGGPVAQVTNPGGFTIDHTTEQHTSRFLAALEVTKTEHYLRALYGEALKAQEVLQNVLSVVAEMCKQHGVQVEVDIAGLKAVERAVEKAVEEYEGDFSHLLDLTRASIVCGTVKEAILVIEKIARISQSQSSVLEVVRVKNRLDPHFAAAIKSGGYRDVMFNVRVASGHVCEVQVHIQCFMNLKQNGGHLAYETARSLHLLDHDLSQVRVSQAAGDPQGSLRSGLARALERVECGTCQSLSLNHFHITVSECHSLRAALLSGACNVHDISMPGCGLDKEKCLALCGLSADTPRSQRASTESLTDAEIAISQDQGLQDLLTGRITSRARRCFGSFRRVNLHGNKNLTGEAVAAFVGRSLEVLSVQDCNMPPHEVAHMCDAITAAAPRRLLVLDIDENSFDSVAVAALGRCLSGNPHLTELNLWSCGLGLEGAKTIAPALAKMSDMRVLYLSRNRFGDDGIRLVAPGLGNMPRITELYIAQNLIGPQGAKALSTPMSNMHLLQKLSFSNNLIGPDGGKALADALSKMPALTELYLNQSDLQDAGIKAMCPALGQMTHMVMLQLKGNKISNLGAVNLATALAPMTSLAKLFLDENKFSYDGIKAIGTTLAKTPSLVALHVTANPFEDHAKAIIKRLLPNIPSLVM